MALSIGQPVNGATASRVLCVASDGTLSDNPSSLSPTFTGLTLTGASAALGLSVSNTYNANYAAQFVNAGTTDAAVISMQATNTTSYSGFNALDSSGTYQLGFFWGNSAVSAVALRNRAAINSQDTTNGLGFFTNSLSEQFRVVHTASATRYVTVTGANAANPAISVSGGELLVGTNAWQFGIANSVTPTSPNRTLTVVIGATTYYIHAKTTND